MHELDILHDKKKKSKTEKEFLYWQIEYKKVLDKYIAYYGQEYSDYILKLLFKKET